MKGLEKEKRQQNKLAALSVWFRQIPVFCTTRMEQERERLAQGYRPKQWFSSVQQQTAARMLAGFFVLMLVFTVLSRAASAATVVVVSTGTAAANTIAQKFTVAGTIEALGVQEIFLPAKVRINAIFAQEGDRVQQGTPLLELDMESLQRMLRQLEGEVELLQLQIKNLDLNTDTAEDAVTQAEQKLMYAKQDYDRLLEELEQSDLRTDEDISSARKSYREAVDALETAKEQAKQSLLALAQEQLQKAELALQEAEYQREEAIAAAEQEVSAAVGEEEIAAAKEKLQRVIQRQNQLVEQAEQQVKQTQQQLEQVQAQTDFSQETSVINAQTAVEQAEEALEAALRTYQDNDFSFEGRLIEARRAVEQAEADLETARQQESRIQYDNETQQLKNQIEKFRLQGELQEKQLLVQSLYQAVQQQGIISAPEAGTIGAIPNETGAVADTGAEITLFKGDKGFRFVAAVDQETAEQLSAGDMGKLTVKSGGKTQEIKVQIAAVGTPNKEGEVRILVELDTGEFFAGAPAKLEIEKNSQRYPVVLPVSALRTSAGKQVVFVVREKETALGVEQILDEVEVSVLAQNSEYVAVDAVLLPEDEVVLSASKPVEKGARVRVEEE